MGLTYAEIELLNPRLPELDGVRTSALADTGAMMLCLPRHLVAKLGLETADDRLAIMADGSRVMVPYVGPIQVRFRKRTCFVGALVMGDEVVLGAVPMEDMDLVVSPLTRTVTENSAEPTHRL